MGNLSVNEYVLDTGEDARRVATHMGNAMYFSTPPVSLDSALGGRSEAGTATQLVMLPCRMLQSLMTREVVEVHASTSTETIREVAIGDIMVCWAPSRVPLPAIKTTVVSADTEPGEMTIVVL